MAHQAGGAAQLIGLRAVSASGGGTNPLAVGFALSPVGRCDPQLAGNPLVIGWPDIGFYPQPGFRVHQYLPYSMRSTTAVQPS